MRKLRNQNAEERMISIETPLLQFTEDELFPDPIDDSPSVIPGHACEHVISSPSSSSPSTKPNPEPEPEIITSREPNPNSNLNVPSDECEHVNAVLEWELHNGQQVKFSLECVPNPNCEDLIKSGSREQHESPNSVPEGKDFLLKPLIEIDGVSYYPQGSKSHFHEMPNHDHNPQIQPNLSHELDLPPPLEDDVNNDQEQQQQQQQGSPDVTLEEDFEDQESALYSEYCMRKKRNLMYISPSNSDEDDEPIPRFLSIEKSHKPHRIIEQSAHYYSPEVRRRRGANGNHTPAETAAHVAVGGEDDLKKRQEDNNSFQAFEHHGEMVKNGVQSQEDSAIGSSEKLDMICYNKQQEPINLNIDSETPIGAAEEGREEAQIHQGAEEEILVPSDDTNPDSIPTKNSQVETTHRPPYPYESDSDEEKEEEEGQTPWYYTFEVSEKRAGDLESETHIVTEIKSDNENIGRVKNSSSDKLGTPPPTNEQPCDHCAVEKEKLGEIRPRLPPIEQSADEEDFFAQLEFHLLSQMNDELGYGDWQKEFCSATSEDHDVSQLASFSAHRNSVWEEKEVILVPTVWM